MADKSLSATNGAARPQRPPTGPPIQKVQKFSSFPSPLPLAPVQSAQFSLYSLLFHIFINIYRGDDLGMPLSHLIALTKLPRGERELEWLASNSTASFPSQSFPSRLIICIYVVLKLIHVDLAAHFYNQVNMLYGAVFSRCTDESCVKMNAGPR